VYNGMVFIKLGDLNPYWFLILVGAGVVISWIPFLGFLSSLAFIAAGVYSVLAAWRVGLKLQKEPVWLILYIFLSLVWLGINAFDKSRWNTAVPPAPWANNFLADKTVWQGVPVQTPAGGYPGQPGAYPQQPGYPQAPGAYPPPAAAYPPPAAPGAPTPPPAAPPAAAQPPADPSAPPAAPTPPPTTQPPAGPTEPPAPPTEPPTTEPPAPPSDPEAPRI